jgi:hypothetical protein
VYLEFPSDVWEHLGRIHRWSAIPVVGESHGGYGWYYKLPYYFLTYSLVGPLPLGIQQFALDVLQAGIAVLLCGQHYRLARACGLSPQRSWSFVFLHALIAGNDLFGFFRYYGLASTLFAQLGAIVVVRIVVEQLSGAVGPNDYRSRNRRAISAFAAAAGFALALLFTAANHMQGLAIAIIGVAAVWLSTRIEKSPRQTIFLGLVYLIANVLVVAFWPKHPLLDSFRTDHWLTTWYGFDLFSPSSNSFRRALLILGLLGAANFLAGVRLVMRNHVVGWMTVLPVIVLLSPVVTIPLCNAFASVSPLAILAFHRLLFAIPAGLALATLNWEDIPGFLRRFVGPHLSDWKKLFTPLTGIVTLGLALMLVPPGYPSCNRLWHAWSVVPDDLAMHPAVAQFLTDDNIQMVRKNPTQFGVIASAGASVAVQSIVPVSSLFTSQERLMHSAPDRSPVRDYFRIENKPLSSVPVWLTLELSASSLYTAGSTAGSVSNHWNAHEVALAYVRPAKSSTPDVER